MTEATDILCTKCVTAWSNDSATRRGRALAPHRDGCGLDWCRSREREWSDVLGARKEGCAWSGGAQKWGDGDNGWGALCSTSRRDTIGQAGARVRTAYSEQLCARCALGRVSRSLWRKCASPCVPDLADLNELRRTEERPLRHLVPGVMHLLELLDGRVAVGVVGAS
jgi:hypothetical protein